MENQTQQILNELRTIKIDIEFIKENIIDMDTILTPKEEIRLNESLEEFQRGETISLEEIEKERKNAGLEI